MSAPSAGIPDEITTADLVDAMGRIHRHRCHILDLVSPVPGRRLFGPAVTISYFPTCNARLDAGTYNFADLFYQAVADGGEGKVLVLASNGYQDTSLAGGTKLARVEKMRLAGVLADGRLRDFDELGRHDFATYCRGEATRWGGDVVTPYQANVPVVVSQVGIHPGDFVFADASGAVVIPASQLDDVVEEAMRVNAEDRASIDNIANESPLGGERDRR
ncbi:MAG TPA: RraA family protein [Acidimicrobiia bacterium]|nr:RraA family protein [Acidimicrobiia bacterium]